MRKPSENSEDEDEEEEKDSDEEGKEPEANEVVWFREEKEFLRVVRHLHDAEGESTAFKNRLQKGIADSGNAMDYLKRTKKFTPWLVKLALLMGISLFLLNDNFCGMDSEMNRETRKLLNCIQIAAPISVELRNLNQ